MARASRLGDALDEFHRLLVAYALDPAVHGGGLLNLSDAAAPPLRAFKVLQANEAEAMVAAVADLIEWLWQDRGFQKAAEAARSAIPDLDPDGAGVKQAVPADLAGKHHSARIGRSALRESKAVVDAAERLFTNAGLKFGVVGEEFDASSTAARVR